MVQGALKWERSLTHTAALALRAAESSLAPMASLVYLVSLGASLVMSQLYRAMTPRLYPSNAHGGLGYAIFWISLVVLGRDVLRLLVQMAATLRAVQGKSKTWSVKTVVSALSPPSVERYDAVEEERMLSAQDGDSDALETEAESRRGSKSPHRVHFAQEQPTDAHGVLPRGASSHHGPGDQPSPSSTLCNTPRMPIFGELHQSSQAWKVFGGSGSDERVASWRRFDDHPGAPTKKARSGRRATAAQLLRSLVRYSLVTVARSLPVLSFAAAYTGLAVYTGSCRGPYGNTCIAHGIKGGIFFWYGLLSFGRYLGAYADLGWAWNRQPSASRKGEPTAVSAEFVECLVIFIYGATNTWMERFNAAPGDPYSVKQVQHISIAVMFWFAGLMGLVLEMRTLKKLLALPVALKQVQMAEEHDGGQSSMVTCQEALDMPSPPPSYSASFNPFPALVIGVTGVAMAAHHQDYVYEVSIHALWGNLLAGFSILRILTYFFLWLRPPTSSIMPSRPPTEALASFSLACGGLVFMLSSEEVSFVAMRNGFGDFMMILNVTVAIVSLVFCCIAGLMILKAYAVQREKQRGEVRSQLDEEQRHPSPSISPVFVLEDDEGQDEKRQLSSSPVNV